MVEIVRLPVSSEFPSIIVSAGGSFCRTPDQTTYSEHQTRPDKFFRTPDQTRIVLPDTFVWPAVWSRHTNDIIIININTNVANFIININIINVIKSYWVSAWSISVNYHHHNLTSSLSSSSLPYSSIPTLSNHSVLLNNENGISISINISIINTFIIIL